MYTEGIVTQCVGDLSLADGDIASSSHSVRPDMGLILISPEADACPFAL